MASDLNKQMEKQIRGILNKVGDIKPFLPVFAERFESSVKTNMDEHGRWSGDSAGVTIFSGGKKKWKKLAPSTVNQYKRKGLELARTLDRNAGGLRSQIEIVASGNTIKFTASKPYARIHQLGGKIKFKAGHSITIPASPYLLVQDEDLEFVLDMLKQLL